MNELIGSVTLSPTTVRPGQPVLVQAHAPDGRLIDDHSDIRLIIDGLEAHERYLQFGAAGARSVYVRALRGDRIEEASATLTVEGQPVTFHRGTSADSPQEPALLSFTPDLGRPYTLRISIGSPGGRRALSSAEAHAGAASAPRGREPGAPAGAQAGQAATTVSITDLGAIPAGARGAGREAAYEWDFGDGTSATTNAPAVTHDYFPHIDARTVTHAFHVTCRVVHDDVTAKRTVALQSAYGLSKRTGIIVPHAEPDFYAAKAAGAFSSFVMVHNLEDQAITLAESAVIPVLDDPGAQPPAPRFIPMQTPVSIGPQATAAVATYVPADTQPAEGVLGSDIPGFTVHYRGRANDGTPVQFSVTYQVPESERRTQAYHRPDAAPATARRQSWPLAAIASAAAAGSEAAAPTARGEQAGPVASFIDPSTGTVAVRVPAGADPRAAREEIRSSFLAGLKQIAAGDAGQAAAPGAPRAAVAPPPVQEGGPVDPENISPAEAAVAASQGLSPQLGEEADEMVLVPGRFANALKGDVIISPGGPDMIGFLLRSLAPPQPHNHTGIMTQNYTEITHCTATGDRLADLPLTAGIGPLKVPIGIQPDALRYMWPGIITQTIDATVNGEPWNDETTGKTYVMQSFSPEPIGVGGGDATATPPLVIKPAVEAPEVRQTLGEVADIARDMAARVDATGKLVAKSKGHYRLYGYTDPSIGLTQVAGPEAGWAAGTTPAVCSSFVWLCLRKKGVPMGGDPAHDGLVYYSAEERRAAARGLHNFVANEIAEQQGWLGNLAARAAGIADGIATQVLNTFACDEPAPHGDPRNWQTTGDCYAVSPDNVLSWFGPDKGGLYGYAEPLIYQEPHWEQRRVFRWTKSTGQGNLSGVVTADGQPIANARVQVYDGKWADTGPDGRYELTQIPQGRYLITGSAVKDGVYYEVKQPVNLRAAEVTADLTLQPPAAAYRRASLACSFAGKYGDFAPTQSLNIAPEQYYVALNPGRVTGDQALIYAFPDGHIARFKIRLVEAADNSLQATAEGWIYDGGQTGVSAEKAHVWTAPFNVPAGHRVSVELSLSASSLLPPWQVSGKLTVVIGNEQDIA